MRIAVIDLGTNTFHLLIVEVGKGKSWKEIYRERVYVYLAENGIQKIGEKPFERGIKTLQGFYGQICFNKANEVRAIGTAALRTAQNGAAFLAEAQQKANIKIELIPGRREAELIYKGTLASIPNEEETIMIMDIGGGSVEFIIGNQDQIFWRESFPIGVAVLYRAYHHSEPISQDDKNSLQAFLNENIEGLQEAIAQFQPKKIVGASGTFDVVSSMVKQERSGLAFSEMQVKNFAPFYEKMISSSLDERLSIEALPEQRAQLIVVACLLIKFVLDIHPFDSLLISKYAMKEGIIEEWIREAI